MFKISKLIFFNCPKICSLFPQNNITVPIFYFPLLYDLNLSRKVNNFVKNYLLKTWIKENKIYFI